MELRIAIKNKTAKDVLERAIDKEISSLNETIIQCDESDFMQYQIRERAKAQLEELQILKDELDQ